MKTKEIDCWVSEGMRNQLNPNYIYKISAKKIDSTNVKAKLVIEIPEKTATITESQFNGIIDSMGTTANTLVAIMYIRAKIFGPPSVAK